MSITKKEQTSSAIYRTEAIVNSLDTEINMPNNQITPTQDARTMFHVKPIKPIVVAEQARLLTVMRWGESTLQEKETNMNSTQISMSDLSKLGTASLELQKRTVSKPLTWMAIATTIAGTFLIQGSGGFSLQRGVNENGQRYEHFELNYGFEHRQGVDVEMPGR